MKIALLHFSAWPEMGGVENMVRDQANMLANAGHEVKVFAGAGLDTGEAYEFILVPELAPDFELNKAVRAVLDRGQSDQNFSQYRSLLVETLGAIMAEVDLTIVHNIFTVHSNLACTLALHDLAPRHKMIAWTHDLTAANSDTAMPNPTKPPWNLMRTSAPDVTYIATSDTRAGELKTHLKPAVTPQVIPNMVDPVRLFCVTPEIRASILSLEIPWRDFVFLLPARVMVRKNIDFAIEIVKKIREGKRNPLLLITGAKVTDSVASEHYGTFLRQSLPPELSGHVHFLNDYFLVQDDTLRDLYLLSDCLLFPSRQEGFGLPVLEAALHRMPVWCGDIPAYRALEGQGSFLINDIAKLPAAIAWLEALPSFRQQRRCRRLFDPSIIYGKYYEPLLNSLLPEKAIVKEKNTMIQEIPYAGWKRNLRIQGPTTELVITLDVGPRIIRYGFHHGRNVFVELAAHLGGTDEKEWMIRGGHRFWTAPEAGHSYAPDNTPVTWKKIGEAAVEIIQPANKEFGFQKTMRVEMLEGELVRVTHTLTNAGGEALDVTPWALSVMAPGGVALIPQPGLDLHPSEFPEGRDAKPEEYLPNREMILWPFTDLTDGRYAFSEHFLRLTYLPEMPATKLGLKLPTGWVAYQNDDVVFAKHFAYDPAQPYPDNGCNFEVFTNMQILELESLAPLQPLAPGATHTHIEHWTLRQPKADLRGEKAAVKFFKALPKIA